MKTSRLLFLLILSLYLPCKGQVSDRKFPRGFFFRNSFYSNAQLSTYGNGNPVEMGLDAGVFLYCPVAKQVKDSLHILQLKYRPRQWSIQNLRFDIGLSPNKGSTFYTSSTESFHLRATAIDLSVSVPLYFTTTEKINGYFSSGAYGCYFLSQRVILNPSSQPPVFVPNVYLSIFLEFGFLIGKLDNPTLMISNRFLEQITGTYRIREFSVMLGIPIQKKFGRIK